jgi:hypothetical protein
MAKRTVRPATSSVSAQPDSAPGSAMTEPTPPPAPTAAAAQPAIEPDVAVPAQTAPAATATTAVAPGAWPDSAGPEAGPRCPWCSAPLASTDLATCPSCGAQLNAAAEGDVPGVTTIDVAALAYKAGSPPKRSRLLSWISGDDAVPPDTSGASSAAVEPPSLAVRREILRLELEAEGINLPHDAEPSGADEAAAVAEATPAPGSDPPSPDAGSTGSPGA